MLIASAVLVALSAPAPIQSVEEVDVAYAELSAGENTTAIEQIESNEVLDRDDPSRLINLGVAHAREGDWDKARESFRAAIYSPDRQLVETSRGEWIDSRVLARQALRSLDRGQNGQFAQVALAERD